MKYDSPNTLFYLDPPYENSEKQYIHDSVNIQDLFKILSNIKGYFILSYNDSLLAKKPLGAKLSCTAPNWYSAFTTKGT